jgi:hypothetical protein
MKRPESSLYPWQPAEEQSSQSRYGRIRQMRCGPFLVCGLEVTNFRTEEGIKRRLDGSHG